MPGAVKKRIRNHRNKGEHDFADWLESRETARGDGVPLWRWEKENPRPDGSTRRDGRDSKTAINELKASNYFKETSKKMFAIPPEEQKILSDIKDNKQKLKEKAEKANETELRTIYKVLKRLDNEEKKIIYKYDFKSFDNDFFDDLQDRVATAPFHFDMVGLYKSSPRACVVCPRGHAKSTTARKYLLHQILYGLSNYIIIVGASEDMAAQNLRWVRDQLTENDKLVDVFGYLKNKDKWADTEFQTNTKIKVTAKGAGQKIRGANERGRPDLIYIDDLEEDEQVSSKDRRDKLKKWFTQALLPSKSRNGRVIITGTILHMDSLLKNISENRVKDYLNWEVLWYQAIETVDGKDFALWPEHKPLEELYKLRDTDPETFAQEYQNNPTSGAMSVFNREEYKYISDSNIIKDKKKVYVKGKIVNTLITTDLALSEKEGADYTVFMVSGMDNDSNLYVLEYERFRSSDPYYQIDMLFFMAEKWLCNTISMEQVAFQKTFKRMLELEQKRRNKFFLIHEISRQNIRKIFRIKSLKGPIKAGKLYWKNKHYEIEEELGQVTTTSLGRHDDVVDALADAWDVQIEFYKIGTKPKAEINTVQWLIDNGGFKTWEEIDNGIDYE